MNSSSYAPIRDIEIKFLYSYSVSNSVQFTIKLNGRGSNFIGGRLLSISRVTSDSIQMLGYYNNGQSMSFKMRPYLFHY